MTEFDFDELDKAVNDLMSGVDTSKRNTSLDDPEDKVIALESPTPTTIATRAVTSVVSAPPVPATSSVPANTSSTDDAPAPSPSLATKRRGQFMDVMHPSSDMTSPAKPVSRQAQSVEPTGDVTPDPVESAPTEPVSPQESMSFDMESTRTDAEVDSAPTESPSEITEESNAAVSQWPDPIDLATEQQAQESPTEAPEAQADSPHDTPADIAVDDAATEPVAPLTSPFLPDAKVEKRPLGEPVTVTTPDLPTTGETTQPEQTTSAIEPAADATEPSAPVAALPEELTSDVIALESSTTTVSDTSAQAASPEIEPTTDAPSEPTVLAGGSILQQYAEQPSSGDQTNGAIFDTKEYHQPVEDTKPAKKSSPLKLIVWIIILLVVGSAAGAAYFYFTR